MWVRSAFVDNAGIIDFDDEFEVSIKGETHNHPSAIEPSGERTQRPQPALRQLVS